MDIGQNRSQGSRNWVGFHPTVTLEDARRLGRECHEKIKKGINPIGRRQKHEALSKQQHKISHFQKHFINFPYQKSRALKSKAFSSMGKYDAKIRFPHIGNRELWTIGVDEVVNCLTHQNFWNEKTETATRVRQRISAVFDWAIAKNCMKHSIPPFERDIRVSAAQSVKLKEKANQGRLRREPMVPLEKLPNFTLN